MLALNTEMTLTQRELGITRNGSRTFRLIHCLQDETSSGFWSEDNGAYSFGRRQALTRPATHLLTAYRPSTTTSHHHISNTRSYGVNSEARWTLVYTVEATTALYMLLPAIGEEIVDLTTARVGLPFTQTDCSQHEDLEEWLARGGPLHFLEMLWHLCLHFSLNVLKDWSTSPFGGVDSSIRC